MRKPIPIASIAFLTFTAFVSSGCTRTEAKPGASQATPVKVQTISLSPVPRQDEYVATVKSRRSASIQPQVDGSLTRILVKSGDHVRAGQVLMTIDPLKQQATVDQQRSTEAQKKAIFEYNQLELQRQRGLYEGGVTSKQNYDYAVQALDNSKADWESAKSARVTQERQLAYYHLTAPFGGIVGDIPVHVGDYVSPQTLLTTVDENAELEAYIYIPTERASEIRMGLPVQIVTSAGELIEKSKVDFISQQVDNALQGVLVKAAIHAPLDRFRNAQLVKARVVWSTAPTPTVPVLAITRIGGQPFVYVVASSEKGTVARQRAVVLGDTLGNDYAVSDGLKPGDKVIVSGTQFLIDGAPIQPTS
ncbi:MAG: efflux RND transporter periplasmic adaptor subunit [Acidobacteria bacterium]|nr:MAG: efflux RND transporter periplasmic adaptor subunit [Acidobacteriota bacterium]PYV78420.1 MAG: efflux RND transporter periplasmic adaptor subunit [Acidobacteriota bacterium]